MSLNLPAMVRARPFDTEFWDRMREAREATDLMNTAALAQVERNREAKVHPAIKFQCAKRRCGLMSVWRYPKGLLIWHPGLRVSARRLEGEKLAGGDVTSTPGARLPETAGGPVDHGMTGAMVIPARAYLWHEQESIFLACEHLYATLGEEFAPVLEAEVDTSLKGSKTRMITLRAS